MRLHLFSRMKNLTQQDVLETIRKEIEAASLRKVAAMAGIDPAFLSRILRGDKPLSDTVAEAFGFERVVTFRKKAA